MSDSGPSGGPSGGPDGRSGDGLGDAARPGTGQVTATVIVNAPAERVFAAFMAWERQSEWIPLTKVSVVEGDGGQGSHILAVTALGPATLRDEIRVVRVDAPYEVRVVHCGTMLRGPGSMRCTPMDGGRTQVVMHEWFHLPGGAAGRIAWPVLWPGSKVGFTRALRKFGRLVEQGRLP
jgi:uncharacterized protein YndB with AHSA1/START domain